MARCFPRSVGLTLGCLFLTTGLGWLCFSATQALSSGPRSDVYRQWVVGQYLLRGHNAFETSRFLLERQHGPLETINLAGRRIYKIPSFWEGDELAPARLAALGAPESTYPPSSIVLLTLFIGWLPAGAVHAGWLLFNVLALSACVLLLAERYPLGGAARWLVPVLAGLALLWPPTQRALAVGQFSLPVLCCLLLSLRSLEKNQAFSGTWLALALLKPSMALPFLLLPLVRRRWGCLALTLGVHGAATLLLALWLHCAPWVLLAQWLRVAGYFTQGMYTLQEILNAFGLENTPQGMALAVTFLLAAAGWCWWHRDAGQRRLVEVLCFVSVFWTYHGSYDFVLLLPPLLGLAQSAVDEPASARTWVPAVVCFVVVGLGLLPSVYSAETAPVCLALRWAARVVLVGWFVGALHQCGRALTHQAGTVPGMRTLTISGLRASA